MTSLESVAGALAGESSTHAPDRRASRDLYGTVRIREGGEVRVLVDGASEESPATAMVGVHQGDRVMCHIVNHRIVVFANVTVPSVNDAGYQHVKDVAEQADELLDGVADAADQAGKTLAEIVGDSVTASGLVEDMQQAAGQAGKTLAQIVGDANESAGLLEDMQDAAEAASTTLTGIYRTAVDAESHALDASRAANSALVQASIVEDVAGTLSWIREHGTFVATTDTSVREGTVYFERDPVTLDYVPVASPPEGADPHALGWYVLDVTDSQSDYIMAHLAVTSAGLWVLPSGIDSQGGPRYSSGYKLLLASDGTRVYDGSGRLVATYGESIDFSSERPQHIGGEEAYIAYYDSDDDGVPDSIYIGGSNVTIGGKTLSQFEQAITDAAAARRYAEDVPMVTLSSTNGTTFKRNLGISTTIIATIFTPGGRIDDATELRRRFGAGAYLEWGWRDVVTDADHVLVSTDPRIIMDGFGLVVSPGDIDSQAVITCSLNY